MMKTEKNQVILLSPAGSFESLQAALDNGADAVYFGVGKLNMRSLGAVNFAPEDLPEIAARCHRHDAKAWLTLNTVVFDSEMEEIDTICKTAKEAGIDAVIAMDAAVIASANRHGLPVHLSVQMGISNLEAVRFYAKFADVMVLARELTLEQIAAVCRGIREERITGPSGKPVGIEVFVHGALCIAISGKCGMSLAAYNSSANRGACYQNCRRTYTVRDTETGTEFKIDNQYVMSPSDLCTAGVLDQILDTGVSVLKIEGRGRSADYTAKVTSVYREALDRWLRKEPFTEEIAAKWEKRLSEVFNRGFWKGGYYLGKKLGEWSASGENKASVQKIFAGTIRNYYPKAEAAEIQLSSAPLKTGSKVLVTGNATGAVEFRIGSLRVDDHPCDEAPKGSRATFPSPFKLRENDKLYLLLDKEENI